MATTINAWEGQLTRLLPPRWVKLSSASTQNFVSQTPSDPQNGSFVILSVPSGVTYTLSTGPTQNGPWTVEDTNYSVGFFAANPASGYAPQIGPAVISIMQPKYRAIGTWDPVAGTGDYTAALIQAITDLGTPGGTVLHPAGTYNSTSQVTGITTNVALAGVGPASQIQTNLQSGINWFSFTVSSVGVVIQDLAFSCSATTGANLIGIYTNIATDVTIWGCRFSGGFTQAINVYQGTSCKIQGCHFSSIGQTGGVATPGDGVNVFTATEVAITGCTFRNMLQDAVYFNSTCKNCTMAGCTVVGGPEGVQIRVTCAGITIIGNAFTIAPSSAVTSFGVAIQNASTDCIVSGNTFTRSGGSGNGLAAVAIQGGAGSSGCHRTAVTGNTINGTFNKGILILTSGAGGTETSDCTLVGNSITGVVLYGIHIGAGENGHTIAANSMRSTSDAGILANGDRATITGNKVRAAGNTGINSGGAYSTVTGNHCSDNATQGIYVGGTYNTIMGNLCFNNSTWGIQDGGTSNLLQGNILRTNTSGSITIASSTSHAYNNPGFNPQGVAAITVTASPFTYTNADSVPEAVYIDAGTVSVIAKNAITVFTSTGKTLWLEPEEACVVTYSVAPTMNKDRK